MTDMKPSPLPSTKKRKASSSPSPFSSSPSLTTTSNTATTNKEQQPNHNNNKKKGKRQRSPCPCNWPNCHVLYQRIPPKDLWKGRHRITVTVGSKLYESIIRNLGIVEPIRELAEQLGDDHEVEQEEEELEEAANEQVEEQDLEEQDEEQNQTGEIDDDNEGLAAEGFTTQGADEGGSPSANDARLLAIRTGQDIITTPSPPGATATDGASSTTGTHAEGVKRVTFTICKHHWTRALNKEMDLKGRQWTSALDLKEAFKFLHTVSESECVDSLPLEGLSAHEAARRVALGETVPKTVYEKQFVRAPNNPAHAVERFLVQVEAQKKGLAKMEMQALLNRNMWIDDLLKQNKKLQSQLKKERDKVSELKKESRQSKRKLDKLEQIQGSSPDDQMIPLSRAAELLHQAGGLSRFTLMSDAWHAANPAGANQFLGYKTWEEAKERLATRFPDLNLRENPTVSLTRKGKWEFSTTSELEKCLAIKLMDRTGLTNERAACIFGRDRRSIIRWRQEWGDRWGLPKQDGIAQSQSRKHMNLIPKDPPLFAKAPPKDPPPRPPPPPPLPPPHHHFLM